MRARLSWRLCARANGAEVCDVRHWVPWPFLSFPVLQQRDLHGKKVYKCD